LLVIKVCCVDQDPLVSVLEEIENVKVVDVRTT
jgi:hypothetical protein